MRIFTPARTLLDAKAATGSGVSLDVSDYDHVIIQVSTASSANLTMKVQGSIAEVEPAWGSAQSVANPWDYIQIKDLEDGSSIDGDVGFAPAGTDDFRIFEVNVNALKWLNLIVTARSAGSVTAIARGFSSGGH